MFVVKFSETTSEPFIADKNGNMPFIGELLCGKASSTLMNGTMFKRANLVPNKLYACENYTEEYEGKEQVRLRVISEISLLEYQEVRTKLGKPVLSTATEKVGETLSPDQKF